MISNKYPITEWPTHEVKVEKGSNQLFNFSFTRSLCWWVSSAAFAVDDNTTFSIEAYIVLLACVKTDLGDS